MHNLSDWLYSGKGSLPIIQMPLFVSQDVIAPITGTLDLRAVGGGGAGALGIRSTGTGATGGNSGQWGVKRLKITKGELISVVIGAGAPGNVKEDGSSATLVARNGKAGGVTVVTVRGVDYIALGGLGGRFCTAAAGWQATMLPPEPLSNLFDFGGVSQSVPIALNTAASAIVATQGAATNLLALPSGAATAGYVAGPSGIVNIHGSPLPRFVLDLWGLPLDGGNGLKFGVPGSNNAEGNGGDGGIAAGGGSGGRSGTTGQGGSGGPVGGGGGGTQSNYEHRSGSGGQGYVCLNFFED